jgi:rhodanese-related sulfurtransferase
MSVQRILTPRARELVEGGVVYLDVRSVPEFESGHVPGAYNIPLMHKGPVGMQPNPEFEARVEATFDKQQALVVGCRSGARSARAAAVLAQRGFETLYDHAGGWAGNGEDAGWLAGGGATSNETTPGRGYEDLGQ